MNKVTGLLMLLALVWVFTGIHTSAQTPQGPTFPEAGSYTAYIEHGGVDNGTAENGTVARTYRIYIPESYATSESPVPMIIGLHGSGDNGENFEYGTSLSRLAEVYGYIAIYPDAVDGLWNAGQSVPDVPYDDVAFIRDIITDMGEALNIDPDRVYVAGFSMGAMMGYRIACEMQDTVAAVAAVGAPLPRFVRPLCEDAGAIPIAVIHGLDDPVVPAAGDRLSYFSVDETLRFWVLKNDCAQQADADITLPAAPRDGDSVRFRQYNQCADDAEVRVYTVEGGGHRWFGVVTVRDIMRPTATPDEAPQNFITSQVIIDFFLQHERADTEE